MPPRRPLVLVLSAPDTLRQLDARLPNPGLKLIRVTALRVRPVPGRPQSAARRRRARVDTIVAPSAHAAGRLLAAWCRPPPGGGPPELWTAGPESARRLRRAGYRRVRHGRGLGAEGLVRGLGPGRRRIALIRSDLAGRRLARSLRARGHRVTDLVGYRVEPDVARLRRSAPLLERARALVVTSPSVLSALRRAIGPARLRRLGRGTPVVVLGRRTAGAARRAGFLRVRTAGSAGPQRFARLLVRTVTDASS